MIIEFQNIFFSYGVVTMIQLRPRAVERQWQRTQLLGQYKQSIIRMHEYQGNLHKSSVRKARTDLKREIPHPKLSGKTQLSVPLPWASVHCLVQCTLECHWNVTGWPSVYRDTTGRPSEYLQGTQEHRWWNLVETAPHWNATRETLSQPTLEHRWRDCSCPHTHPGT